MLSFWEVCQQRTITPLPPHRSARHSLCRCARILAHELEKAKQEHLRVSMSESESAINESQEAPAATEKEDITYQAVEKDGVVTAIWEMKGRKHLRTIDPRSRQGREILNLYTTEDVEHPAASEAVTS